MTELTQQEKEILLTALLDSLEDLVMENNYTIWIDCSEADSLNIKLTKKEGE